MSLIGPISLIRRFAVSPTRPFADAWLNLVVEGGFAPREATSRQGLFF
jgi:hypothetical protein